MSKKIKNWRIQQSKFIDKILFSIFLLVTIILITGCDNLKPIWTEEGWQNYKEFTFSAFREALIIILWGGIPSALGILTSRSVLKQALLKKSGKRSNWLFIKMYLLPVSALILTLSFFFSGHWVWGILSVITFIAGILGLLILPGESD